MLSNETLSQGGGEPLRELFAAIPDPDALLELEPEELGAKMLFLLRARREEKFHPGSLLRR
jgi:hypothetical protein